MGAMFLRIAEAAVEIKIAGAPLLQVAFRVPKEIKKGGSELPPEVDFMKQ